MGISATNSIYLSLRGRPSLYHAGFSSLLEMSADDCNENFKTVVEKNPCVTVKEPYEAYQIIGDQASILAREEARLPDSHYGQLYLGGGIPYSHEDLDAVCVCNDFAESLPIYISTHAPTFRGGGKRSLFNAIVSLIDGRGFLDEAPAYIAEAMGCELEEVEEILGIIRSIEPGGIGSRDLKDFLWYQCEEEGWDSEDMRTIIFECLDGIARERPGDCEEFGIGGESIRACMDRLRTLRPYPTWGMDFPAGQYRQREQVISPDFILFRSDDGEYFLQVNETDLKLNRIPFYKRTCLNTEEDEAALEWMKKVQGLQEEARRLKGMFEERKRIILSVVSLMLARQMPYLTGAREYKDPLTISEIATQLNLQVSTVSRAVKNKVIATPRGTFGLKNLLSYPFPAGGSKTISQDYLRLRIRQLDCKEDGKRRSDREIAEALKFEGIEVARRTVNKHRE